MIYLNYAILAESGFSTIVKDLKNNVVSIKFSDEVFNYNLNNDSEKQEFLKHEQKFLKNHFLYSIEADKKVSISEYSETWIDSLIANYNALSEYSHIKCDINLEGIHTLKLNLDNELSFNICSGEYEYVRTFLINLLEKMVTVKVKNM